jgi:hypothetical protein
MPIRVCAARGSRVRNESIHVLALGECDAEDADRVPGRAITYHRTGCGIRSRKAEVPVTDSDAGRTVGGRDGRLGRGNHQRRGALAIGLHCVRGC